VVRLSGPPPTQWIPFSNWWGTNVESEILDKIAGLANVDFTPYLASGDDDDDTTPGFQGDFSTLYVTALGQQSGVKNRIQEAVDLVDNAVLGTVNVNAGTYELPTTTVNRGIAIGKENVKLPGRECGNSLRRRACYPQSDQGCRANDSRHRLRAS
jgi:hypothetical protein